VLVGLLAPLREKRGEKREEERGREREREERERCLPASVDVGELRM
jgi:hypothetical protein